MYSIVNKKNIGGGRMLIEVEAPRVAEMAQPGQFMLVMNNRESERTPKGICAIDKAKGTVSFVACMKCQPIEGDSLYAVTGPLGKALPLASDAVKGQRVLFAADRSGIANMMPIAQWCKANGATVDIVLGGKDNEHIYLVEEYKNMSDRLMLSTGEDYVADMGETVASMGKENNYAQCIALGSVAMMKSVSLKAAMPVMAQIMGTTFDGSGMGGDGRVTVDGKVLSASIDGPFFDGKKVDFDELLRQCADIDASRSTSTFSTVGGTHTLTEMETTVDPTKLKRVHPQRQTAECRIHNFDEVSMGYTEEQAKLEASRCLNCKNPRCSMKGCPIHNRIPEFIHQIVEGNYEEAYQIISTRSTLPAICGRVCPHEQQCEGSCVRGMKGEPVSIGNLERFVADWHREHHPEVEKPAIAADAKKVAVIGGGPSGMACAHDLAQMGYKVTIFEAMHEAGGVMIYGIPEFVLPKKVVRHEVEKLQKMGVTIETNAIGGKTVTVDDLMDNKGFEAVYIAAGAGLPRFMGIPGETLNGVMSANELLAKVTMMHANEESYKTSLTIGKRVAVIGGGNVAIDAARVARRLGAEVTIVYRRDEENMPARRDEIQLAKEENIALCTQTNPVAFLGDEKGNVCGMRCVRMEMGEPDESGRRSFSVIEGSEFEMPIDNVFLALGSSAIPIVNEGATDVATDRKGLITADEEGRTSRKGVFAGGDIVSGPQTVVLAMGAGRKAAKAIDQYFRPEAYTETETTEA